MKFSDLQRAVQSRKTEKGALNKLTRELANAGYNKSPGVGQVRRADLGTIRTYVFDKTPVGNIVLIAGPKVIPELKRKRDLTPKGANLDRGILVEMGPRPPKRKLAARERNQLVVIYKLRNVKGQTKPYNRYWFKSTANGKAIFTNKRHLANLVTKQQMRSLKKRFDGVDGWQVATSWTSPSGHATYKNVNKGKTKGEKLVKL